MLPVKTLLNRMAVVTVFANVKNSSVLCRFKAYLYAVQNENMDDTAALEKYSEFLYALYNAGADFGGYLLDLITKDDNVYVRGVASGKAVSECIKQSAHAELQLFTDLSQINPADIAALCGSTLLFENTSHDFFSQYQSRLTQIGRYGYGIFCGCGMFRIADGRIVPVESADTISTDDFIGYSYERNQVYQNTRALVEGRPAANVLLCGDAGTGKSSTVKAAANAYYKEGVRLIELRKDQLTFLPEILGTLRENPLKFIIFIDDLSFNKNDDNFSMLKAALEGSASAKTHNAVIYATSNRRHIVKESFADRAGDEVHRNDTMQELWSLSERFGLTVLFQKPDKKLYLEIVRQLAENKGVQMDAAQLDLLAEAYALKRGGRSARAAEQFTDSLL